MKKSRFIWIIIFVVVAALIAYPKVKTSKKEPQTNSSQKNMAGAVVRVAVVSHQNLQEIINTSGSLISDEEVDLKFETSGKITGISFKEGSRVKKGQLLAKLNDQDLQAQLGKLEIQHKLASEKEARERALLEREAVSQESYDQLRTDLQGVESEIEIIKVRIAETEIHAPFDGIIGLRYVSEGAFVGPETSIARLIKNKPLKIDFSIPERYSGMVKAGTDLVFRVENSQTQYKAQVYAVEPKVDPRTRTIAVRAVYPNASEELQAGRFVNVELIIREIDDALKVPTEAIIPELGGEKVFTIKNNKAQSVKVKTGLRTEKSIEITEGLNPGDTIVTNGVMQLRNDMPVVIDQINEI